MLSYSSNIGITSAKALSNCLVTRLSRPATEKKWRKGTTGTSITMASETIAMRSLTMLLANLLSAPFICCAMKHNSTKAMPMAVAATADATICPCERYTSPMNEM